MKVFVSATTRDLLACREAVKSVLLDGDLMPRTQEHFPPDHRPLNEYLRAAIFDCDVVICLVGTVFGEGPDEQGDARRSYTQMEYDVARECGKPVFVFMTKGNMQTDPLASDSLQELQSQQRHREALLQTHKCELFSTVEQLKYKVAQAIPRILESGGRLEVYYLHPPKWPGYFVGRSKELSQIRLALQSTEKCVIAVLGMGGQGKTTLVAAALRQQERLPFAAGFWCTAYCGGFTFDNFLDKSLEYLLGEKFNKKENKDDREPHDRLTTLLRELQRRPILIVIDGVERWLKGWSAGGDPQTVDSAYERGESHSQKFLGEFLAAASGLVNGTHVVLTARALPAALDTATYALIPVRRPDQPEWSLCGLDPEAAVDMLRTFGIKGDPAQLRTLAQHYACHPLALEVLGGQLCNRFGGRLTELPRVTAFDPNGALWELFSEARKNLPGGVLADRFLIAVAHCLDNPPVALLTEVLSQDEPLVSVEELIDRSVTLANWNLLGWDGEHEVVRMHPLLKQYFAAQADTATSFSLHRRIAEWYREQTVTPAASTMADVNTYILAIEHALLAGDVSLCNDLVFAALTADYSFVEWIAAWGHHSRGTDLLGRIAAAAEGLLRALILIARAALNRQRGDVHAAVIDLDDAVSILRQPGQDAARVLPHLAAALSNRSTVHLQMAAYDRAIFDLDSAVALLDMPVQRGEHPFLLSSVLVNRAMIRRETGHVGLAIEDCTKAIYLHLDHSYPILQAINHELASILLNRGSAFTDLHEYAAALSDYDEAARIYTRLIQIGKTEFRYQMALVGLGRGAVLPHTGKFTEGMADLDEAIKVLREGVAAGREDLESYLALGYLCRADVQIGLMSFTKAAADIGLAIMGFTHLVQIGHTNVQGLLARAYLIRSLTLYQSDAILDARKDRGIAKELGTELIRHGERQFGCVFLRYSVRGVLSLLRSKPDESLRLLKDAVDWVEEEFRGDGPFEVLRVELQWALLQLEPVLVAVEGCDFDRSQLQQLRDFVQR